MAMDLSPTGEHLASAGGSNVLARSHLRVFSNQHAPAILEPAQPEVADSGLAELSTSSARPLSATSSWTDSSTAADHSSDAEPRNSTSASLVEKDSTVLPSKGDVKPFQTIFFPLSTILTVCIPLFYGRLWFAQVHLALDTGLTDEYWRRVTGIIALEYTIRKE